MEKKRILILSANPSDTEPLRLEKEYGRIQKLWDQSDNKRERFDVRYYPDMSGEDLQNTVLNFKPHILHFCGHGDKEGIYLSELQGENSHHVGKEALVDLVKRCAPNLDTVVLNACYSAAKAEIMSEQVNFVAMADELYDKAAISFAKGFYSAVFRDDKFEVAVETGLGQMRIDNFDEKEIQKVISKVRPKTYLSNCKHDIFVYYTDEDMDWANDFIKTLDEILKHELDTPDGFQICKNNDLSALEFSATLLIILSGDYLKRHKKQPEEIHKFIQKKSCRLIERNAVQIPDVLQEFPRHMFWKNDDKVGITPLKGMEFITKKEEVSKEIGRQLKGSREKYVSTENAKKKAPQNSQISSNLIENNILIFLDYSNEDFDMKNQITSYLDEKKIPYVEPPDQSGESSAKEVANDYKSTFELCDGTLILYDKTPYSWARIHALTCCSLIKQRTNPIRNLAVYQVGEKPDLKINHPVLRVYKCPLEQITIYLEDFLEAFHE